jgi:hypothetical protein
LDIEETYPHHQHLRRKQPLRYEEITRNRSTDDKKTACALKTVDSYSRELKTAKVQQAWLIHGIPENPKKPHSQLGATATSLVDSWYCAFDEKDCSTPSRRFTLINRPRMTPCLQRCLSHISVGSRCVYYLMNVMQKADRTPRHAGPGSAHRHAL